MTRPPPVVLRLPAWLHLPLSVLLVLLLAGCQPDGGGGGPGGTAVPEPPAMANAVVGSDAGEQAYAACAACHGPDGEGNPAVDAPAIGGLDAAYLARQVRHFRDGLRGADPGDPVGRLMHLAALTHPVEGQLDALAEYIAAKPGIFEPRDPASAPGDAGAQAYAVCGACHGPRAEGNPALGGPALGGQHRAYLVRQLQLFKSGRRGANAQDIYGQQMAAAVAGFSDEQLAAVAAFLAAPDH